MAQKRLRSELLPLRPRRSVRRNGAVPVQRRRCILWFFLISLLSLAYISLFQPHFSFLAISPALHYAWVGKGASMNESANFWRTKNFLGGTRFSRSPRHSTRKHHVPCKIDFLTSVDSLIEPENYINFTRFSLNYITQDRYSYNNNSNVPQFGGQQTLEDRENSYYAKNQMLHCGFVRGNTSNYNSGFDLDEKDKEIMASCTVVVSSCIFGNSDFLRRPTKHKMGTYTKTNVCFMMFMDALTLAKLSSEGNVPDENGKIGLWRVILVKNFPYIDMRKTGKVPKFLSHRLFPSARYSIWVDSKMRVNADPMLIIEYFLWRKGAEYAISRHYDRSCVWEEVLQNKRLNKYNHTLIDEQFNFYQSDGLVRFNQSDSNSPLPSFVPEGSFIVRAHTPMSNLFSCLWFNEVNRFTSRDQLSFAYTFLKLRRLNPDKPFYFNMFMDCERRAVAKLFHHRTQQLVPAPVTQTYRIVKEEQLPSCSITGPNSWSQPLLHIDSSTLGVLPEVNLM